MDGQRRAYQVNGELVARGRALSEQARPDPQPRPARVVGVVFRCEPCSRALGRHAPALAILERVEGTRPWVIRRVATWGRRFEPAGRPRTEARILPGGTETNRYACRRCRHKPRVKAPELFALADQAHAAGRDYFYR